MKRKLSANSRIITELFTDYPNTFIAFCELINNSIQADATEIKILIDEVGEDELYPIPVRRIEIFDNGIGVSESDFNKKILQLGTDVKNGGRGIGRFSALQIGATMKIETQAYDRMKEKFTKTILPISIWGKSNSELSEMDLETKEEIIVGSANPYYKVEITDLYDTEITEKEPKKKVNQNLRLSQIKEAIFTRYPSYIFDEQIKIYVNNELIDSSLFVLDEPLINDISYTNSRGIEQSVNFSYYHVKTQKEVIKVFLTVENAGIRSTIGTLDYSADWLSPKIGSWFIYVHSDFFTHDLIRNLDIMELSEEQKLVKQFIKNTIDDFFKEKNRDYEEFQAVLAGDKHYPYKEVPPTSESKKIAFDKVAYLIEDKYHLIKSNYTIREIIYPLVDQSIANGNLRTILKNMVKLDEDYLEKFNVLLEKTDIEDVIQFSESVADKNQFLDFLYNIVYGEPAKYLKERSQLHKIIEKKLWIFGEHYSTTAPISIYSDKNLRNNLEKLREKFFSYELSESDGNLQLSGDEQLDGITDLFFFNERTLDSGNREIMIVELKAPKCHISKKELNQIDEYCYHIESEGAFSENLSYKLLLVSTDITPFGKSKLGQISKEDPSLYYASKNKDVKAYVIKWSDIIEANRRKLSFLGSALKVKDIDAIETFEKDFPGINIENIKTKNSRLVRSKAN